MRVEDAGHPAFPIQIAGGQLGERRHVCGVFEDPEAAYRTLLPFILDGFERGQRAFHIVDPAERRAHIERLAHAGVDVEEALGAGQLQVETWDSVYLRGGRFDRAATVNLILNALTEGRELGFPITRLIGFMGWTYPDAATAWDLASYESQVEAALRGIPDPVVCAYDLERIPSGLLIQMLGLHPLGIVDGRLRRTAGVPFSPRDRILEAASELFAGRRVNSTGVDMLIERAGVAKATFYRHFPSKDALISEWLLNWRARWIDRLRPKAEAAASSPEELIPVFFDVVAEWLEAEGFRGCPYLNTAVEIVDPAHPARQVVRDYLNEVAGFLRDVLESTGHPAAEARSLELQALLAGGMSLAVAIGARLPCWQRATLRSGCFARPPEGLACGAHRLRQAEHVPSAVPDPMRWSLGCHCPTGRERDQINQRALQLVVEDRERLPGSADARRPETTGTRSPASHRWPSPIGPIGLAIGLAQSAHQLDIVSGRRASVRSQRRGPHGRAIPAMTVYALHGGGTC